MNHDELTRIFRDPPVLDTPRLTLRRMLRRDSEDMFAYARDPAVSEFLLWQPHESEAYTRRYLNYLQSRYRSRDFYDWAVVWRESGRMIGTCGFTQFNLESNSAEIGYVLARPYWGIGIAPEAARAVLRFGFRELRLHRIEAHYMIGNDRSRRVMEKIGMHFEGVRRDSLHVKGRYVSVGVCSILEDEFRIRYGFPPEDPQN